MRFVIQILIDFVNRWHVERTLGKGQFDLQECLHVSFMINWEKALKDSSFDSYLLYIF